MMNQARVIIADDHAFVLHGLVNLLADRFDVIAAVPDGKQLVEAATRLRPDVVVTDISMPGMNGVEALTRLKGTGAKVVVLTLYADPELAAALLRSGASGFVVKLLATRELITAVEHVLQGEVYCSTGMDARRHVDQLPAH
jgi:DNA-binding NarL/FixJ family response regulator